jgi:hypothetical protein
MGQVCTRWLRFIAACAVISIGLPSIAADSHDPEALAIWRQAVDIHSRDYGLLHECTVTGEMRVTFPVSGRKAMSDVSIQVKDKQLWMKLSVREQEPNSLFLMTEKQVVCDGKSITEASFSERIRPTGCKIDVHDDDFSSFGIATYSRLDPRIDLVSHWFREDHSDKLAQRRAFLSMDLVDGRPVITLNETDGQVKFRFDADCGQRLVRMESKAAVSKSPAYIYEYTYAKQGDFVLPKSIVMRHAPTTAYGYQLDIRTIVPGVEIKVFDNSTFKGVPAGTRSRDLRRPLPVNS